MRGLLHLSLDSPLLLACLHKGGVPFTLFLQLEVGNVDSVLAISDDSDSLPVYHVVAARKALGLSGKFFWLPVIASFYAFLVWLL